MTPLHPADDGAANLIIPCPEPVTAALIYTRPLTYHWMYHRMTELLNIFDIDSALLFTIDVAATSGEFGPSLDHVVCLS